MQLTAVLYYYYVHTVLLYLSAENGDDDPALDFVAARLGIVSCELVIDDDDDDDVLP